MAEAARRPDDAVVPEGFRTIWDGWHILRHDRQYGAMGGETPIPFLAIDAWARRYRIADADFDMARRLILAMDGVHLEIVARRAREAADQAERDRREG